jgi:hypothetical protein
MIVWSEQIRCRKSLNLTTGGVHVAYAIERKVQKIKKPAIRNESRAFKKDPAATYSPTQKVMQYHRR